jgi:tight adherence protein B
MSTEAVGAGLVVLSGVAAAAGGALLAGPSRRVGRRRDAVRARPARLLALGAGAGIVVAVGAGLDGRHLGLLVVLSVAALGVLRGMDRSRRERLAQARRLRVVDYCEALVGELRAGQPVTRAVERSVDVWPEAAPVAAAAGLGASVPGAMRRLAELPGAEAVRRLAGAWEISASTGAGLVLAVEQVLATVRAEDATARLVRSELASARATARLVTALPVVVLLAAQGIGARPWHFLLDSAAGVACLGGGVVLSLTGLAWIDRIAARSVESGG